MSPVLGPADLAQSSLLQAVEVPTPAPHSAATAWSGQQVEPDDVGLESVPLSVPQFAPL